MRSVYEIFGELVMLFATLENVQRLYYTDGLFPPNLLGKAFMTETPFDILGDSRKVRECQIGLVPSIRRDHDIVPVSLQNGQICRREPIPALVEIRPTVAIESKNGSGFLQQPSNDRLGAFKRRHLTKTRKCLVDPKSFQRPQYSIGMTGH
jgi:hypothetical protein